MFPVSLFSNIYFLLLLRQNSLLLCILTKYLYCYFQMFLPPIWLCWELPKALCPLSPFIPSNILFHLVLSYSLRSHLWPAFSIPPLTMDSRRTLPKHECCLFTNIWKFFVSGRALSGLFQNWIFPISLDSASHRPFMPY